MPKFSPALDDAGSTKDSLSPRGPMTCGIDMSALRRMSMKELHDIRGVLHAVAEIVAAFSCQPRFATDNGNASNEAGKVLEEITEFLNGYEQAAVNVAEAAKPARTADVEWRGWALLGFHADMADVLADFAVLAAEAVRDEAEAKFRERHAKPCAS